MKVRLKHEFRPQAVQDSTFQFHEGPIKTNLANYNNLQVYSFNSMKVRLKLINLLVYLFRNMKFQFHEGPIKTAEQSERARIELSFNSMKVRLKLLFYFFDCICLYVSIP